MLSTRTSLLKHIYSCMIEMVVSQLVLLAGERMDVKRCVGRGEDTDGSQMEGDLRNGGAWIHTEKRIWYFWASFRYSIL